MKGGTVNFTIGDGFGIRIMQIAQEHLLYLLDPIKAIDAITGSFVGMTVEYALKILSGEVIVEVADNGYVNTRPRNDETDFEYPELNAVSWYKDEFKAIGDDGRTLYRLLDECLRGMVNCDGRVEVEIEYSVLLKYFSINDPEELLEVIKEQTEYDYIVSLISASVKYLKRTYQVWGVMKFLEESYPCEVNSRNGCSLGKHDIVNMLAAKLNMLTNLNIDFLKERYSEIDAPLMNHIKAEVDIRKELEKQIEPLPFEEKRCSGWISPKGEWFGLDGEVSNLLHITLAEMIRKKLLAESDVDIGQNPYNWLESNGWAKITGNWVLFDGYSTFGDRVKHSLTEEQKAFINAYCNAHYKGVVCPGYTKQAIPSVRLTFIEDFAVEKYFKI